MIETATQQRNAPTATLPTIELSRHDLAQLQAWGAAGYPAEACGLLVGKMAKGVTRIVHVAQARNLRGEDSNHRYAIDPIDYLKTERAARKDGFEVVGFWHSHPDHPPVPSSTDLEAAWPGVSYLIVETTATGGGEARSWLFIDGSFRQQPLTLEDLS